MDRDWMRQRLEAFDALATEYLSLKGTTVGRTLLSSGTTGVHPKAGALLDQVYAADATLKKILKCLDPELATDWALDTANGVAYARRQAQRGLGVLADMDEWATRLKPDAPSLPADQFHPWVWDAARTFWESKHFRAAVHAAASSISAHLQSKLGRRDVTDATLVQEALSSNAPEPGKPRLRFPGDPTNPDVKTRQRGALLLGQGAYSALRNPAAHGVTDLPEQEALEQLATFSVLARLIDSCQVVKHV
ncbi:TIGR02391 family protein [Streptomyces sp. NPDC052682]|uniref:TIGR02391 family protein n=1 Tax=Streptomyces sp. NPDC052682 TaxID=3154954 RepID=UPI00342578DE